MTNKTSIPRIKNVRLKEGGAQLYVLPNQSEAERKFMHEAAKHAIDNCDGHIAGMALVVWTANGSSVARLHVGPTSNIPSILVPDFVRNRLLAERIESWTIETVNEQCGGK